MDNVQKDGLELVGCYRLTLKLRWPAPKMPPEDMVIAIAECLDPLIVREEILLIEGSSPDMPGASIIIPGRATVEDASADDEQTTAAVQRLGLSVDIARKINQGICVNCERQLNPGEANPCELCVDEQATDAAADEALDKDDTQEEGS